MDFDKLAKWLLACGAEVRPVTPPYELYRFMTCEGVVTIYQNKHGIKKVSTICPEAKILEPFRTNRPIRLNPNPKTEKVFAYGQKDKRLSALITRDGDKCFFCGCIMAGSFNRPDPVHPYPTLEHLIPLSRGGPDTLDNLLLACAACNHEAGNMNIVEKVRLRDSKLSARTNKDHTQPENQNDRQDPKPETFRRRSRARCDDARGRPYPLCAEQPDTHR